MMGVKPLEPDCSEFVELDPTGRYGRYNEILGKGSSKTVYRAFDEYEGIEVAWNQVKLHDFLQSPEDLERLYCEIHLLKTLKHENIMKFYTSWVDTSKRNINFVTEMFTSGTLRQYRQKHRRVNIRAVKHWCRQILNGLLYLHNHDPPVIHRDLKCDNILINGNQGEVKIGDLGLAAILRKSHAAHCVGTPEFMAPEVYEEAYNELVDIYSFGMCVLEMVTFEYPYSECTHPAQIYKKVISGTKPEALYKVEDPEVRQFVEKCLATASRRLPARELLKDPFLQIGDFGSGYREGDICESSIIRQPYLHSLRGNGSLIGNGFSNYSRHEIEVQNGWDYSAADDIGTHEIDLFNNQDDELFPTVDITIKGRMKEDGGIFLRLRMADRDGRVRNIYFSFDIEADTALTVATEMVAELDITDYDVTRIAEMIDGEVSSLVPEWKSGPGIEEMLGNPTAVLCHNCRSNVSSCGSLLDYLSSRTPCCSGLQSIRCSHLECAAMHGRFEEITYQVEGSEQCVTEGAPVPSNCQSDGFESVSQASRGSYSDEEVIQLDQLPKNERAIHINGYVQTVTRKSLGDLYAFSTQQHYMEIPESGDQHPLPSSSDDYENEVPQELRWLKAKYQIDQKDCRSQQFGGSKKVMHPTRDFSNREHVVENGVSGSLGLTQLQASGDSLMKSLHLGSHFSSPIPHVHTSPSPPNKGYHVNTTLKDFLSNHSNLVAPTAHHCEVNDERSPESMFTARSFYYGVHQPQSLTRTKSLF